MKGKKCKICEKVVIFFSNILLFYDIVCILLHCSIWIKFKNAAYSNCALMHGIT